MFSRSNHVVGNGTISFFFEGEFYICTFHIFFYHFRISFSISTEDPHEVLIRIVLNQ